MNEPTFVIAGGQRCGTTTLYNLLDSHPDVFLAKPVHPEPKFFLEDPAPERGRQWYLDTFFSNVHGATAIGEKSTSYIEVAGAASRMRSMFPGIKVVFCLRHPVERAISNYRFSRKNQLEALSLDDAIREEPSRLRIESNSRTSVNPFAYMWRGEYAKFLKPFFDIFTPDSIRVIITDELESRPDEVLRELFSFLGVEPEFTPQSGTKRSNEHLPDNLRLSEQLLNMMCQYFWESNDALSKLIGRDLQHWNRPSAPLLSLL